MDGEIKTSKSSKGGALFIDTAITHKRGD